jgi:hypothetical protein
MWPWRETKTAGKRHVIVHYHIFKNAGTTILFILKRNFGKRVASLESDRHNTALGNDVLLDFLSKHPKIQAVTSHHLWPPYPEHEQLVFHDVLFLRHPLARLSSMYDFYRRTDTTQDPLTQEAKKRNTADFMKLLIDKYPHHVTNAQVTYLSARSRQRGESELEAALRIARRASVLGVTELFDIGAVLAENSLTPFFPGISFAYVARNVSSSGPRDLSVHLAQIRDACGDKLFESLLNLNSLDLGLLQLATEEMYSRFQLIPDHEERLKNFSVWRSALDPDSMTMIIASNHPANFIRYANLGND